MQRKSVTFRGQVTSISLKNKCCWSRKPTFFRDWENRARKSAFFLALFMVDPGNRLWRAWVVLLHLMANLTARINQDLRTALDATRSRKMEPLRALCSACRASVVQAPEQGWTVREAVARARGRNFPCKAGARLQVNTESFDHELSPQPSEQRTPVRRLGRRMLGMNSTGRGEAPSFGCGLLLQLSPDPG